MAGGKASRLGGLPKPLLVVCGKPMLLHVVEESLEVLPYVVVATGRCSREVAELVKALPHVDVVELAGEGYVADLSYVLRMVRVRPLLVLPADMPFISANTIVRLMAMKPRECVITVKACGEFLGASVFGGSLNCWRTVELPCTRELMDVDTLNDLARAQLEC
jgi:GTP:adenosylcobinamide-phosphate guanylyltransferase